MIFALLLLLIITTLTLVFLNLQYLEGDLVAAETDNIQAFYLANAGLEWGKRVFDDNRTQIVNQVNTRRTFVTSQSEEEDLALHKTGTFSYRIQADPNSLIILGTGTVNHRTRRMRLLRLSVKDHPPEPFDEIIDDYPYVVFLRNQINFQHMNAQLLIYPQGSQSAIRIQTLEQQNDLKNFGFKNIIAKARFIENNDNRLLFKPGDIIRDNYDTLKQINSYTLPSQFWNYPFDYIEERSSERGRTIIKTKMVVQGSLALEPGTYFFESLTLEEGAKLATKGDVKIYVTSLELKENAQLIGGGLDSPNPNRLVVLAEYWDTYPFMSSINKITIGSGAIVHGYIIAPSNIKAYVSPGPRIGTDTRIYGNILADQIILYKATGTNPSGFIRIYGKIPEGVKDYNDTETWKEVKRS